MVAAADARPYPAGIKSALTDRELLPEHDPDAAQDRIGHWESALKPADDFESWALGLVAVLSRRVERCFREESALRALAARRAATCWDGDRRLEAEELGARLARDPARVKLRLERTPQGCAWLAARWKGLLAAADRAGTWGADLLSRASDLLGRPSDARHEPIADPSAEARAELERLSRRESELADLDAAERELAECGMGPEVEKAVRGVRRYETACLKRLEWARSQIGKMLKPHTPRPVPPFPPVPPRRPEPDVPPSRPAAPPATPAGPSSSLASAFRSQLLAQPGASNRRARRAARTRAA